MQQPETLDQAEALAERSKEKNELLVQIKIENRHDYASALKIIDEKITNLKEKVNCLQQYVPKFLKNRSDQTNSGLKSKQTQEILAIVKDITKALVDYTKHDGRFEVFKDKYTLKHHQKIKIEDLLQIFVDDLELQKNYLFFVIEELASKHEKQIEKLT